MCISGVSATGRIYSSKFCTKAMLLPVEETISLICFPFLASSHRSQKLSAFIHLFAGTPAQFQFSSHLNLCETSHHFMFVHTSRQLQGEVREIAASFPEFSVLWLKAQNNCQSRAHFASVFSRNL